MKVFHFLRADFGLLALRDQRLKVAHFDELNDPFELYAAEMGNRTHRERFRDFKRWAASRFGLICFCRGWRNPLLWSHYADKHRGVCLEFQAHRDDICSVTYSPRRLLLDVEKRLATGGFSEDDAYQLATTKFKHWKYEDEVRLFIKLADCPTEGGNRFQQFGPRLELRRLIAGPASSVTVDQIKNNLAPGATIAVDYARLAFRSFHVVRDRARPSEILHGTAVA